MGTSKAADKLQTRKTEVPKALKGHKKVIIKLASTGASRQAITRKLKVTQNFFNHYTEAAEWYQLGRDLLAQQVSDSIIASTETSYLDRKLLTEKLNLFCEPFDVEELTTPEGARNLISKAIGLFTSGHINEASLGAITRSANAFIESYNQTVLMKDVSDLKKALKERMKS